MRKTKSFFLSFLSFLLFIVPLQHLQSNCPERLSSLAVAKSRFLPIQPTNQATNQPTVLQKQKTLIFRHRRLEIVFESRK